MPSTQGAVDVGFAEVAVGGAVIRCARTDSAWLRMARAIPPTAATLEPRWNEPMHSGRKLWNEHRGVSGASALDLTLSSMQANVNDQRFNQIAAFLKVKIRAMKRAAGATLRSILSGSFSALVVPPE